MKINTTNIRIQINHFMNKKNFIKSYKKQIAFQTAHKTILILMCHFHSIQTLLIIFKKILAKITLSLNLNLNKNPCNKIHFKFKIKINIQTKIMISFSQILPFNMKIPIKINLLILSQIFNLKKNLLSRTSFKFWIGMTKVRINKIKIIFAKKSSWK